MMKGSNEVGYIKSAFKIFKCAKNVSIGIFIVQSIYTEPGNSLGVCM